MSTTVTETLLNSISFDSNAGKINKCCIRDHSLTVDTFKMCLDKSRSIEHIPLSNNFRVYIHFDNVKDGMALIDIVKEILTQFRYENGKYMDLVTIYVIYASDDAVLRKLMESLMKEVRCTAAMRNDHGDVVIDLSVFEDPDTERVEHEMHLSMEEMSDFFLTSMLGFIDQNEKIFRSQFYKVMIRQLLRLFEVNRLLDDLQQHIFIVDPDLKILLEVTSQLLNGTIHVYPNRDEVLKTLTSKIKKDSDHYPMQGVMDELVFTCVKSIEDGAKELSYDFPREIEAFHFIERVADRRTPACCGKLFRAVKVLRSSELITPEDASAISLEVSLLFFHDLASQSSCSPAIA